MRPEPTARGSVSQVTDGRLGYWEAAAARRGRLCHTGHCGHTRLSGRVAAGVFGHANATLATRAVFRARFTGYFRRWRGQSGCSTLIWPHRSTLFWPHLVRWRGGEFSSDLAPPAAWVCDTPSGLSGWVGCRGGSLIHPVVICWLGAGMGSTRVELFAAIRFDRQRGGLSIRALARKYDVHRRTVRQALESALPPERRRPVRQAPVLERVGALIDGMLVADLEAPPKQRHTAQRVFERLIDEHDAQVSYSYVAKYVHRRRREIAAAKRDVWAPAGGFVPQPQ